MIEKPIHVESAPPLVEEKPGGNLGHDPVLRGHPSVGRPIGRPMKLALVGAISIIAVLAFVPDSGMDTFHPAVRGAPSCGLPKRLRHAVD